MDTLGEILQWDRRLRVEVDGAVVVDFDTSRPGAATNAGLDADVSATLLSGPEPQPSTTTIYGLAKPRIEAIAAVVLRAREQAFASRQVLRVGRVRVFAGRPPTAALLVDHEIVEVATGRSGADTYLRIEARDGRVAWSDSFVTTSTSPFYDPTDAARAFAARLGITTDPAAASVSTSSERPDLVGGFAGFAGGADRGLLGSSAGANQRLLSAVGRRPVWVRGELRWVRPDLADLTPAVELLESSTLLWLDPPQERGIRRAVALLDPLFEPGRQVWLRRKTGGLLVPTPFRVESVVHTASTTRDDGWTSDLVLRPSLPIG